MPRLPDVNGWDREKFPNDLRYFLVPSAKLLAYLPPAADRLIVYKVDTAELLAKSGRDFLIATGKPPPIAERGKTYSFSLGVLSKKGNVKYKVESGPKGMAVAADGKLTWAVPGDFADNDADAIITVSDASGREIFVSFKVAITGAPVAVKPPDKEPDDKPPDKPPDKPADLAMKVAPLKTDKEERPLPSTVERVCVGGGRFLIFHLANERKVAVFDCNEAKVVKYLPVAEDSALIAACADKLFVVLPTANVIQRYSLATFEKELTAPVSAEVKSVSVALLGSASRGPLMLNGENGARFFDPYTLKALPDIKVSLGSPKGLVIRMSADGRVITSYMPGSSPQFHTVHVRSGDVYKAGGLPNTVNGMLTPGPEGRFVYTAHGLYTVEGKGVGAHGGYGDGSRYSLPSAEGELFFLRINVPGFPHGNGSAAGQLYLHLTGDDTELAAIDGAQVPTGINNWGREAFGFDQHFFLVPSARLLVILAPARDKLFLHRIDVDKMLEKSNRDYLVVLSRPPASAERGSRFTYAPVIKAKKSGVKVKLESGPDGMKVGVDGRVSWDVPKDFAEKEADVILTISDSTGQEKFHTFRLSITGKSEAPKEGPPPDPPKPEDEKDPPAKGPGVGAITPAPLKQDREERALPSTAGDVCVGGGGRFLILHLPKERTLAVFDVNEAKVVKYLPVAEDNVLFAAGKDKLFVANPSAAVVQRYSLATFKKELTVALPGDGKVNGLLMGSASAGPLLLGRGTGALFLDPATLKEIKYEWEKGMGLGFRDDGSIHVRISADGRLITSWQTFVSPTGLWAYRLDGATVKGVHKRESPGTLFPNADGSTIFAPGQLYAADATPIGKRVGGSGAGVWFVPAVQGRYYLSLNQKEEGRLALGVHLLGHDRHLALLPEVTNVGELINGQAGDWAYIDKHLYYIPDARVLVYLPKTKDKLVLYRVDLDALLQKSGVDYLFVTSAPPATFIPGQTLTYTPVVKSKRGGVKVKLDAGPAGMTVSPKYELTWKVPDDFAEAETTVTLTISDATGQEVSHTFRLTKGQPTKD